MKRFVILSSLLILSSFIASNGYCTNSNSKTIIEESEKQKESKSFNILKVQPMYSEESEVDMKQNSYSPSSIFSNIDLSASEKVVKLNNLGDESLEENKYEDAAQSYYYSLRLPCENHDLSCFLKRVGVKINEVKYSDLKEEDIIKTLSNKLKKYISSSK